VENKTESRAQEGNAKNDTKSLSDNQQLRLELRRRADTCNSTRPPPHFYHFPSSFPTPYLIQFFSPSGSSTNKRAQATEILAPVRGKCCGDKQCHAYSTSVPPAHRKVRPLFTWLALETICKCACGNPRGPGKQATLAKTLFVTLQHSQKEIRNNLCNELQCKSK